MRDFDEPVDSFSCEVCNWQGEEKDLSYEGNFEEFDKMDNTLMVILAEYPVYCPSCGHPISDAIHNGFIYTFL